MRVRFTRRGRDDLVAILAYIDAHSPRGARNVKRTIQKTIELIGQSPDAAASPARECCLLVDTHI